MTVGLGRTETPSTVELNENTTYKNLLNKRKEVLIEKFIALNEDIKKISDLLNKNNGKPYGPVNIKNEKTQNLHIRNSYHQKRNQ